MTVWEVTRDGFMWGRLWAQCIGG